MSPKKCNEIRLFLVFNQCGLTLTSESPVTPKCRYRKCPLILIGVFIGFMYSNDCILTAFFSCWLYLIMHPCTISLMKNSLFGLPSITISIMILFLEIISLGNSWTIFKTGAFVRWIWTNLAWHLNLGWVKIPELPESTTHKKLRVISVREN